MITAEQKKQFKTIGHNLKPVVTVAGNGLSESVMAEFERALRDHELIKIKLAVDDRAARSALLAELCGEAGAELVQSIGKTALIYRGAAKPDPRLSNVLRGTRG